MKDFSIILAVDNENGLGNNNNLAWDIPEDRKYFKEITTKTTNEKKINAVIMGRRTWESIPEKYRPFSKRENYVLSRKYTNGTQNEKGAYQFNTIDDCLEHLRTKNNIETIFVIGGSQLYNQVLQHPNFKKAYITTVYEKYHCDVFFDGLPLNFNLTSKSERKEYDGVEFEFSVYEKKISFIEKIKNIFKK